MAESASGFDPAKEFPNIVWNFDNLAEPAAPTGTEPGANADAGAEEEEHDQGLITAPPTPLTPAKEVVSVPKSAARNASPVKAKSTPAKRSAPTAGSSRKKLKASKSTPKMNLKEEATKNVLPLASAEEKTKARITKNQARKEAKRERRRQKRKEVRSKGGEEIKEGSNQDAEAGIVSEPKKD
ncbi:hypothetical protein SCARD494_02586 [Seiridium cardinale]